MIQDEKQRLRAHLQTTPPSTSEAPSLLVPQILGLAEWDQSASLLLFAPLPGEPDVTGLLAHHGKKSFHFPRISGDSLQLFRWQPESSWITGPFGVQEPDPESWEESSPDQIDLALIPGLAFDCFGGRLGRGKGYYDRLLGDHSFRGLKAGICHEERIFAFIPMEPHDIPMDLILTEQRVVRASSRLDNPSQSR